MTRINGSTVDNMLITGGANSEGTRLGTDESHATNRTNPIGGNTGNGGIQVRWYIHDHDGPNEIWVSFDQAEVCWGT